MSHDVPRPRFIAWGELLWDLFRDGPRLGGAAANAAYHAACLGAQSHLVSRVGQDELGARALRELSELGVDVNVVQVDADAPTGTVQVEIVHGEPRTLPDGPIAALNNSFGFGGHNVAVLFRSA